MNQQQKLSKKTLILIASVLVVLIAAAALIFTLTRPKTQQGAKTVQIEIVVSDTDVRQYTLHTDAEFLRQALEEQNLIQGEESEYGLFVLTVDGVTADADQMQWWCFTKDGEMLMTGVDTTPVADEDQFEITLTTGY